LSGITKSNQIAFHATSFSKAKALNSPLFLKESYEMLPHPGSDWQLALPLRQSFGAQFTIF
jgi:hypothetical protein